MLSLSCRVEITQKSGRVWQFGFLRSCAIAQDMDSHTDTCTVELPRKIRWRGAQSLPVARGDAIRLWLGYAAPAETQNPASLPLRFDGVIRSISAGNPLVLHCDDRMFLLKQKKTTPATIRDCTLQRLASALIGADAETGLIDDVRIGTYRITQPTVARELDRLQQDYGFRSFFRIIDNRPVLYIGLGYPFDNQARERFAWGKNIISDDLQYRRAEDMLIRVQAISILPDGSRITEEAGDPDGELRTLHYYGPDAAALKKIARARVDDLKYSGFAGSFVAFGQPVIRKADIVTVKNSDGAAATHLVKAVDVSFGTDGYRQTVTLGPALQR